MARTPRPCPTCGSPVRRGPGQHAYCSDECRPACAYEGCSQPTVGTKAHCDWHTEQLRRHGELRPPRWGTDWICVVCGADVPKGSGRRKHCSGACQAMDSRSRRSVQPRVWTHRVWREPKGRPKSFDCVKCGVTVDLLLPSTKNGQRKRCDSKMCDKCKKRTRSKMSVRQLARRDGADCKICGTPVDLSAGPTDKYRPSVDHVIPRAWGGTNDPSNLQLAHLWCNQVKHTRQGFSLLNIAPKATEQGQLTYG